MDHNLVDENSENIKVSTLLRVVVKVVKPPTINRGPRQRHNFQYCGHTKLDCTH